jgi:hypothetical protein
VARAASGITVANPHKTTPMINMCMRNLPSPSAAICTDWLKAAYLDLRSLLPFATSLFLVILSCQIVTNAAFGARAADVQPEAPERISSP